MAKQNESISREDEVLLRMLKTPPKPHAQIKGRKAKASLKKKANPKAKAGNG